MLRSCVSQTVRFYSPKNKTLVFNNSAAVKGPVCSFYRFDSSPEECVSTVPIINKLLIMKLMVLF